MARSLSNAKLFAAAFTDDLSLAVFRRGYAAGPQRIVGGRLNVRKVEDSSSSTKEAQASEASSAWAPDPVTGYYRPANQPQEIDPVELREMLLNNKTRPN